MVYNARNIIVGAAALFFSQTDSTTWTPTTLPELPAAVVGTPYAETLSAATTAWRHAGYTSEGLELAYGPDWTDIEVDQLLDSAKIFKTSMRATLNTTLVESQLENLLVAWGQAGDTLINDAVAGDADRWGENSLGLRDTGIGIAGGGLGDEPVERALVAVGPAPRKVFGTGPSAVSVKRERVYYARRCLSVDSVSVAVRRDEATMFPVSFRLLPDPAFVDAEYGYIRDRNVTAAPAAT